MKTVKLLLVSPLPPPAGGIASWSVGILRELRKRQDLAVSHVDTAVRWRSTNDCRLHLRVFGGFCQLAVDSYKVLRAIRSSQPQVLHLCTSASLGAAKDLIIVTLASFFGVKCVIHYRFGRMPQVVSQGGWEWQLVKRSLRRAAAVVLLDKASVAAVRSEFPGLKVEQIPNPIDPALLSRCLEPQPTAQRTDVPLVVFAGHVIRTKGVTELVQACRDLIHDGLPVRLELVGQVEEDYRLSLVAAAGPSGNGSWLTFRGQVSREESVASIRSADLFVLPSHTEGFPNVILEAMAMRRAIVATRVGAIPEMLGDGIAETEKCGVLVDPEQLVQLKSALRSVLADPEKAHRYGSRAQEKVLSLYTMEKIVARYARLWSSL